MFAWSGVDFYTSPEQARQQVNYRYQSYYPGKQSAQYQDFACQCSEIFEEV